MLPSILDIALEHNLTIQPRSLGKKQALCKCPFCREDELPGKRKKYYLSLNTEEQLFRCWFCGIAGGVFRFISLLEGIPEQEVADRHCRGNRNGPKKHPAEKLTSRQCRLMGLSCRPNWAEIKQHNRAAYRELQSLVWKAWQQWLLKEKRLAYQLLVAGIAGGCYQSAIRLIQEREKEIGERLLEEVLALFSKPEHSKELKRLEILALHIADPLQFPFSLQEETNE